MSDDIVLAQIALNIDYALSLMTQCSNPSRRNHLMLLLNKLKKRVSDSGALLAMNGEDLVLWEISVSILNQIKSAQETDPDFQYDFGGIED